MKKRTKIIRDIIFLSVIVIGLFWLTKSSNESEEIRFQEGNFAIGFVDKYERGAILGNSNGYRYHFDSGQKQYHYFNQKGIAYKKESRNLPPIEERDKIKTGDKFLVIFDKDGSQLLFDYPISDSLDFKAHIKTVEKLRDYNTKHNEKQ
ncbi:hypothetical protein SLH46_17255 [Draconibacterium sp. IB214405]|uniref:hypothetical protein n=1 Tax=Draconibacterium sp. IB214405 TaxID=3097352 RepID=UPI002A183A54|nr:hypothetical protein [Draconibacterium sp. IB214405]MDX8340950.1 hypothetical protein [Draconibacterium sp. IB214405]